MVYAFIFIWLLGTVLSVKADAILSNEPTDWSGLLPAVFLWPVRAIRICVMRHPVYEETIRCHYRH